MKRILISLRDLKIGGIEKACVTLIKYLANHQLDVTLAVEEKKGELLKEVNSNIKIIEYMPSAMKPKILRKIINFFKRLKFLLKYKNRFDVSISYATYSKTCSFIARNASKNSILWCHADYYALFNKNKAKMHDFFYQLYYDKFSKIVFVSRSGKESFEKNFPNQKNVFFCNNLINDEEICKKSCEKISIKYNPDVVTFLNVGRHDEKQKKLTRIIKAAIYLKRENYKFRIIFVGDGEDTLKYKKLVEKYKLQNHVIFVGKKENPYPYYKISNCVLITSDYEGYPVVFLESQILNIPIITTDVSDYKDIQKGNGIVVKKDSVEIYKAMKSFIENGCNNKNEFNVVEYNLEVEKKLEQIL